jgi:hypothetical protein
LEVHLAAKTKARANRAKIREEVEKIRGAALNLNDLLNYDTEESSWAEQISELARKLEDRFEEKG